ncbi:MAG TPA: hypothetical protein DCS88_07055 [Alphaproteobacteria bacterium]|nr:hypothetical protein [Alphaproteobacteria bacterium]
MIPCSSLILSLEIKTSHYHRVINIYPHHMTTINQKNRIFALQVKIREKNLVDTGKFKACNSEGERKGERSEISKS